MSERVVWVLETRQEDSGEDWRSTNNLWHDRRQCEERAEELNAIVNSLYEWRAWPYAAKESAK